MIRRILYSRGFVATLLAMATGALLFYRFPFPEEQIFLHVISVRAPQAFLSFKYLYAVCIFTTPYVLYSGVLSGVYVFTLKVRRRITAGHLPMYADPATRDHLFLVVGEVHNERKPGPSETPRWLTIPERGLFTGVSIFGAVGSSRSRVIFAAR